MTGDANDPRETSALRGSPAGIAVLDQRPDPEKCTVCGRPLRAALSRVAGMGPTCAQRLGGVRQ